MNKRWILALLILICAAPLFAQTDGAAYVSNGVFVQDTNVAQVLALWQHYLASRPDSVYDNPNWNSEEKRRYHRFDIASEELSPNLYLLMRYYPATVMSIGSADGELYRIRTLFAHTDSVWSDPLAIVDVYANKTDGTWKLRNALLVNTANWQHRAVGPITFIFPTYHTFNDSLARKLVAINDSMARVFDMPPIAIDYYFANTLLELQRATGFAFEMGESDDPTPGGKAYAPSRLMSAGMGEYYPHELVHLYLLPKYPNAHNFFHEGVATFVGGSRGLTLDQLLAHTDSLLNTRPSFDGDSLLSYVDLDRYSRTAYFVGGTLVAMAYDKGGWPMVKRLFNYGSTKAELKRAIVEVLGIPEDDIPAVLRTEIHRRAHQATSN